MHTSFKCSTALVDAVQHYADKHRTNRSEVIRRALMVALADHQLPQRIKERLDRPNGDARD